MTIASLLREAASAHPDKIALHHGPTTPTATITYRALDDEVDRVAAGLQRLGISPGDRVAIAAHNVPEFVFGYVGAIRAGAVAVPLNAMLTEAECTRILRDSGAKVVIGAPPFGDVARRSAKALDTVEQVVLSGDWDEFGAIGDRPQEVTVDEDDLAVLAYTSGTTAEPKGAMLTHGNLMSNLDQQTALPEALVSHDDVLFLALPLFHIFGLNVTLGLMVRSAASGVLLERFDPVPALRALQECKVTVVFGAPPMYVAWVNTPGADQYDLSSVRMAISGAAPLSVETLNAFKSIFGVAIYEGYGLTETSPALTSSRVGGDPRPGSVGKPLPGLELRIVDEDINDVEVGDTGEVIVRGPNVFKGYWKREDETAAAFVDDWFRTGDIAVRDEEGYVYLVDRKRDLIIVSGFNVFPAEIEAALLEDQRIEDAAVVGVPHAYTGEAVKAYVVLADGADASEADLLEEVAGRLARFKCPESIEIVDTLPHMLTGKVLRRALRT